MDTLYIHIKSVAFYQISKVEYLHNNVYKKKTSNFVFDTYCNVLYTEFFSRE